MNTFEVFLGKRKRKRRGGKGQGDAITFLKKIPKKPGEANAYTCGMI